MKKISTHKNEVVIYQAKSGAIEIKKDVQANTVWATQAQIADIFGAERSVITKHIRNILADKELNADAVCAKFAHTGTDGKIYQVQKGVIAGIVGNVIQSFDDNDLYPTLEEKAAHLLYFMVKNHPFTDGNKRSGAYAFIWFLQKAGILDRSSLTPSALTALTLLLCAILPRHATTERIGRNKNKFAYYMFAYYICTDNFVKQII